MKKLISLTSLIVVFSTSSYGAAAKIPSLLDLSRQSAIKQVLNYPILTPEEKEKFNDSGLNAGPLDGVLSLKDQNFDFLNLSGIRLRGADFEGVHFNGTNFEGADLQGCNFKNATFKNVNLKKAILIETNVEGCSFNGTDLHGAILTETLQLPYYLKTVEILELYHNLQSEEDKKDREVLNQLIGTAAFNFEYEGAQHFNLSGINLKNCNLRGSDLDGSDLTDAQFENTILGHVGLSEVKLSKDFCLSLYTKPLNLVELYADLGTTQEQKNLLNKVLKSNIRLKRSNITSVVLDNLDLSRIDLSGADLEDVSFKNSILIDANLSDSKLKNTQFQGAVFVKDAKIPEYTTDKDLVEFYSKSTDQLEKDNLNKFFDVYSLDLKDADLRGLNLKGMHLDQANLEGTRLQGTILFDDFKVPNYNTHEDLIRLYSHSQDKEKREKLNRLLDVLPLKLQEGELDLKDLNLEGIHLNKINLFGFNLSKVKFNNAVLKDVCLDEAYLSQATLPNGYQVIEYGEFDDLIKKYHESKDEKEKQDLNRLFENTSFNKRGKDYNKFDLSGIHLIGCKFNKSKLQEIIFREANLKDSIFTESDLQNADFTNANLNNVKFKKSNLKGALLFDGFKVPEYKTDADLVQYYSNSKDQKERQNLNKLFDLMKLDLKGADLRKLDLTGINLGRANLENTDFTGSILTNIILNYIFDLNQAKLDGTQWSGDFVLPLELSEEKMKGMYAKDIKTDQQKYLFKKVYEEIKRYNGLDKILNSSTTN